MRRPFDEEVAQVFGVPFEVVPFKATGATPKPRPPQRRIYAVPQKAQYAITVPRVLGYSIGIRNRVTVDWPTVRAWSSIPRLFRRNPIWRRCCVREAGALSPGGLIAGRPGAFHRGHRVQQLCFRMATDLTRHYVEKEMRSARPRAVPAVAAIVQRYIAEKVDPLPPAGTRRVPAPYYGWIIERLLAAIRPDTEAGEAPELPELDRDRPCATADISVFTAKQVREAVRSHVNLVIIDSVWEAAAAELLDAHPAVGAYIKNDGLNFTVPICTTASPRTICPTTLFA